MATLADLTVPYQDLFRSSYNLGFHPAVLLGDTPNLDGQRALVQNPLDYLAYTAPQSIQNVNLAPNSVSDWNLNNITFKIAKGQSLFLGGINNTNGLLQVLDSAGNVIIQEDNTGQTFFDTAGHKLVVVSPTGFRNFDVAGGELTAIDANGFHTFDGSGNEVTKAANNGYILRKTKGMFFEQSSGNFSAISQDATNVLLIEAANATSSGGLGKDVILLQDSGHQNYVAFRKNNANVHLTDLFSILVFFDSQGSNPVGNVSDGTMWYDSVAGKYYGKIAGNRVSFNTTPAP